MGLVDMANESKLPFALYLGQVDENLLKQAYWIIEKIPIFERSNGSGKFYRNYITYNFWKDSQLQLIKEFVSIINNNKNKFIKTYKRDLQLSNIYMSRIDRSEEESCVFHRDGYWWNGQFHMSILGDSNILVKDETLSCLVKAEPGTVWYLNSSEYTHKISPSEGQRLELLAPCNYRQDCVDRRLRGVTNTPERWIDSAHPSIIEDTRIAQEYMKKSFKKGRASSSTIADWTDLLDFEDS